MQQLRVWYVIKWKAGIVYAYRCFGVDELTFAMILEEYVEIQKLTRAL